MKVTVTERLFRDMFATYNREGNFSSEGLSLIFNYLEQLEEDTGNEMELDVIALCRDYSELTLEEFASNYFISTTYEEPIDVGDWDFTVTITHSLSDSEWLKKAIEETTAVVGFTSDNTVVFCTAF